MNTNEHEIKTGGSVRSLLANAFGVLTAPWHRLPTDVHWQDANATVIR